MYLVKEVKIKNGFIRHNNYTKIKTVERFLGYIPGTLKTIKVKEHYFNKVYLTEGNEENGFGYAFVKL